MARSFKEALEGNQEGEAAPEVKHYRALRKTHADMHVAVAKAIDDVARQMGNNLTSEQASVRATLAVAQALLLVADCLNRIETAIDDVAASMPS